MAVEDEASGHVQDVGRGELEVDSGTVGVVDDCREEGVLSCYDRGTPVEDSRLIQDDNETDNKRIVLYFMLLLCVITMCYYSATTMVKLNYLQFSLNLIPTGSASWSMLS